MNDRIFICQMTLGHMANNEMGLLFTSEQDDFSEQSIIYAVPIVESISSPHDLYNYFKESLFCFPAMIGEKYYELESMVDFPELIFTVPNTDYKISFEVPLSPISQLWSQIGLNIFSRSSFIDDAKIMRYVGKHSELIPKNDGFLPLLPIDILEMDELYLKHKGIFVGFTPEFSNNDQTKGDGGIIF